MKKDLINLLACPNCKGQLTLSITKEDNGIVVSGSLQCKKCVQNYPIKDSIPNLIPPDTFD